MVMLLGIAKTIGELKRANSGLIFHTFVSQEIL